MMASMFSLVDTFYLMRFKEEERVRALSFLSAFPAFTTFFFPFPLQQEEIIAWGNMRISNVNFSFSSLLFYWEYELRKIMHKLSRSLY
jgi:hypothetical protein